MSVGPNVNAPASEAKDQHDRTDTATPLSVTIVFANEASWEDLQVVLGTHGHRSDCWCQRFRMRGTEWDSNWVPVEERARRLREQTHCGQPEARTTSGLVAYLDGGPVGWCAVATRSAYVRLGRVPWAGRAEDRTDCGVGAVTCFVTRKGFRGRGISRALAVPPSTSRGNAAPVPSRATR
jgi:GNAT superfamily N-acetyltransferase